MAGSFNQAILVGNLGSDPEIRDIGNGRRVATFRIATSERWTDKQSGEKREVTDWHTIVVWPDGLVKTVERYLKKGSSVMVAGKIKTRKWQDRDGNDRWVTEIVLQGFDATLTLIDKAPGGNRPPPPSEEPQSRGFGGQKRDSAGRRTGNGYGRNESDDEIPF